MGLYGKIFEVYSEAEKGKPTKESEKFQLSHLSFAMGELIDPNSIKKAGASTDNYKGVLKAIDSTQGDFKKLKGYETLSQVLGASKTIADATKKSKYLEAAQDMHSALIDNKKTFEMGYKKDWSLTKKIISGIVFRIYLTMFNFSYNCSCCQHFS